MYRQCRYCPNDSRNPAISIDEREMCRVCASIKPRKSVLGLIEEMNFLFGKKCIIGMSGGKDSTATAWMANKLFNNMIAFTLDSGYYPEHIFPRAKKYAEQLGLEHETIDIRIRIQPWLRECFKMTADLFDNPLQREDALCLYALNREHYSVKDRTVMPFIRPCQLCRKVVIPTYYETALKHGASVVLLGMNEWTHLTGNQDASGLRCLHPWPKLPPVWIAHLPYLMGWTMERTRRAVTEMGWELPPDEGFVETNSNSCLFARASERQAFDMLGFHPDTTRLAREVTAGFISKEVAVKSLERIRDSDRSVRQVLKDAEIIR
jgi:hypothetical protein